MFRVPGQYSNLMGDKLVSQTYQKGNGVKEYKYNKYPLEQDKCRRAVGSC